jgi:hydroxymethylbilane synthase
MTALRLGTRRSPLALAQSQAVAAGLSAATGREVELVEIVTEGDRNPGPLALIGGTGVFTSGLRDALLRGDIDIAVHSYKDLPVAAVDGLVVAAIPPREDPRDVLVSRESRTLAELPPGSRVGTGSPRRAAQLRALGYGLDVVDIRGNVDTRLRKVADAEVDAVVLARAGLARLHRLDAISEVLDPQQMLPAPGQGALALECRADGAGAIDAVSTLDDASTRVSVTAERALLAALEAGCSAPVGALADVSDADGPDAEVYLRAVVVAVDGSQAIRLSATGAPGEAGEVGRRLAAALIAEGADGLMGERIP